MVATGRIVKAFLLLITIAHADHGAAEEPNLERNTHLTCVGRFIVEVPALLHTVTLDARFGGFAVANLGPGTAQDLAREVRGRRTLMEAGGPMGATDGEIGAGTRLSKRQNARFQMAEDRDGTYLLVYDFFDAKDPGYSPSNHDAELYFRADGHLFRISGKMRRDSMAEQKERLYSLAGRIVPRAGDEPPSKPGFCLRDTLVEGPPVFENEQLTATFRNDSADQVLLAIEIQTGTKLQEPREFDWPARTSQRVVGGIDGIQALGRQDNDSYGSSGYRLWYHALRKPGSRVPGTELFFRMERAGPTTLEPFTADIALGYWNQMLDSFRGWP